MTDPLTVVREPDRCCNRIEYRLPDGYTVASFWRRNDQGGWMPIPGGGFLSADNGVVTFCDFEAPLNTPVSYQALAYRQESDTVWYAASDYVGPVAAHGGSGDD